MPNIRELENKINASTAILRTEIVDLIAVNPDAGEVFLALVKSDFLELFNVGGVVLSLLIDGVPKNEFTMNPRTGGGIPNFDLAGDDEQDTALYYDGTTSGKNGLVGYTSIHMLNIFVNSILEHLALFGNNPDTVQKINFTIKEASPSSPTNTQ